MSEPSLFIHEVRQSEFDGLFVRLTSPAVGPIWHTRDTGPYAVDQELPLSKDGFSRAIDLIGREVEVKYPTRGEMTLSTFDGVLVQRWRVEHEGTRLLMPLFVPVASARIIRWHEEQA